ncbi:MAG: CPBP family glutamic-type intramembrane protease [Planctomycetota bacterium]
MRQDRPLRIAIAVALVAAVDVLALLAAMALPIPRDGFLPPAFATHTAMLVLSVALMGLLAKGRLGRFGVTRGTYRFRPRILLWVLPTAILSVAATLAAPEGAPESGPAELSKVQTVLFVWIYASVSEEVLTRGLLLTLLAASARVDAPARRRRGWAGIDEPASPMFSGVSPDGAAARSRAILARSLRMPVLVSGLFFGAMHLVLVPSMGPAALFVVVLATLLGLLAGHCRERTGSHVPAILVHALFNIGGSVPMWVIEGWRA